MVSKRSGGLYMLGCLDKSGVPTDGMITVMFTLFVNMQLQFDTVTLSKLMRIHLNVFKSVLVAISLTPIMTHM